MDRDLEKEMIEDSVTRLLRQAFGVDEDQLLRDFLLAQTEIKDDQIPPEPEDGFEILMKKMKARGIRPKYINPGNIAAFGVSASGAESDTLENEPTRDKPVIHRRRHRRLGTVVKAAVVAAVLVAMVLGMGITVGARKSYTFNVSERRNIGEDIIYNRGTTVSPDSGVEEAYQKIRNELGINVLVLSYTPKDMVYDKINIGKNRATMYFEYNGKMIYVIQQIRLDASSYNFISDRNVYKEVYNDLLGQQLSIEMNITKNGEKEFEIQIVEQDSYYSIMGIMEETEFERIVENIYFRKLEK